MTLNLFLNHFFQLVHDIDDKNPRKNKACNKKQQGKNAYNKKPVNEIRDHENQKNKQYYVDKISSKHVMRFFYAYLQSVSCQL